MSRSPRHVLKTCADSLLLIGTFDGCAGYCDTMFQNECLGVAFAGGYCMAFDAVSGTFNAPGEIAALRQ